MYLKVLLGFFTKYLLIKLNVAGILLKMEERVQLSIGRRNVWDHGKRTGKTDGTWTRYSTEVISYYRMFKKGKWTTENTTECDLSDAYKYIPD